MKTLGFTALMVVLFSVVLLTLISGRILSFFVGVSPVFAQVIEDLAPKIVQTDTQIVIFENPLVDEEGLTVDELIDRRQELLGKSVVVKGAVGSLAQPWGFWMEDTSKNENRLFVVNHPRIASQTAANFTLTGQKYLRIRGTVKQMVWTDDDSTRVLTNPDEEDNVHDRRLVLVADEMSSIVVGSE